LSYTGVFKPVKARLFLEVESAKDFLLRAGTKRAANKLKPINPDQTYYLHVETTEEAVPIKIDQNGRIAFLDGLYRMLELLGDSKNTAFRTSTLLHGCQDSSGCHHLWDEMADHH
jgi:hypothetical protein